MALISGKNLDESRQVATLGRFPTPWLLGLSGFATFDFESGTGRATRRL